MEYNDIELVHLVSEQDEVAKDALYEKYNYIIDIIMAKYKKVFYVLNMDASEVRQDAMLAFSDALVRYSNEKDTSLATFISLVIERKIQNCVRSADTIKNKKYNERYSLDYEYEAFNKPLSEIIGDADADPLVKISSKEAYQELTTKIKSVLSPLEYEVYKLLVSGFTYIDIAKILEKEPKQIDNTIQRLRTKIKELI
ncbi:MAG: sigma-70 family RNA polymerase sigma factor [Bacilli bacterium]|nr:sigma-70 family RNA polymerase sigma factor [Bacilli bacterium]MDD4795416.1 sigma-70 family RNA polymerase sigma factor [Bacilli bacterium]